MPYTTDMRRNHLLAALPAEELAQWLPCMEATDLAAGRILCECGDKPAHVYFPTTAIVSLQQLLADGGSTEVAAVGLDGVVGVSLFMGGEQAANRAVVQSAGRAYRLGARAIQDAFVRSRPVMQLMLVYTQALITQTAQIAACNRHHSLDQQLCRLLLISLDRLPGNELRLTQELISNMLGVRREGVTEAAGRLQSAGVIRYSRGHIVVLDRGELERRACECYGVVKREYDRLIPTAAEPVRVVHH